MLYGVSVGPGDPELMTLKAMRILRECTVIAVPLSSPNVTPVALEIACNAMPELIEKKIVRLSLPMTRNMTELENARIIAVDILISLLKAGENIAFLTLGDVSIYSTYMYLHERIIAAGYEAQMIPGVPSFCAAGALRGGLTKPDMPLHIIPASYGFVEESLTWPGMKVLMKSGKSFPMIKAVLEKYGLLEHTDLVEECGMKNERLCPLSEADKASYFSILFVEEQI